MAAVRRAGQCARRVGAAAACEAGKLPTARPGEERPAVRTAEVFRRRRLLRGLAVGVAGLGIIPLALHRRRAAAEALPWVTGDANGLRYDVLLPADHDPARRYPVVLYLHQLDMGNWPDGLRRQVNAWFGTEAFRSRHPCIVVVPVLDQTADPHGVRINFGGKGKPSAGEDNAIAALRQVMSRYLVEPDRVYVTGNSLGGMGAWQMLIDDNVLTGREGHLFAAGMPLAGRNRTVDPAEAAQALRDVPIWAFHGARDKEVSPDWDRTMARLLGGRRTFRYTEIPDLGHEIWDSVYTRPEVWDWLFAQSGNA
jgi:predicted peptidase